MLGSHEKIFTLGEFDILPWEIQVNKQPCGCGVPINECGFWSPLIKLKQSSLDNPLMKLYRNSHTKALVIRWEELFENVPSEKKIQKYSEYGKLNFDILKLVVEKTGNKDILLCDSSKDLYRLRALHYSGLFNIQCIHMVRGVHGFLHSITKPDKGIYKVYKTVRMNLRWLIQNFLFEHYTKKLLGQGNTYTLYYEKLASNSKEEIKKVSEWLGIAYSEKLVSDFRTKNHAIAGNPMRRENKMIILDEKWKKEMPYWQKSLISIISFFSTRTSKCKID